MWQRARSEEQIEERGRAILNATARLFKSMDLEEITLSSIAKEADFTRSNVYKYFPTREDIFLAILQEDMHLWRRYVEDDCIAPKGDLGKFCEQWVDIQLEKCKRMINLQTILYTVIEKKCSYEKLVEFKIATRDEYTAVATHLITLFPQLSPQKSGEFLYAQMALTRGVYPMLNPLSKQCDAMREAKMVTDYDAYRQLLINSVLALLKSALS